MYPFLFSTILGCELRLTQGIEGVGIRGHTKMVLRHPNPHLGNEIEPIPGILFAIQPYRYIVIESKQGDT